jgi:hypothetical protein
MKRQETQQEMAEILAKGVAKQLALSMHAFPEPNERLTLCMSTALVGLMGAIQGVSQWDNIEKFVPTDDHVLFVCLLVSNSVYSVGNTSMGHGFAVEYDVAHILRAMDQFKDLTGRSFEPMMNRSLVAIINEARKQAASSVPNTMGKFLPQ